MNKVTEIRKAVFPVAGLGTRFLPATKAQPKEMLPIVDKPLIQYAVEEAYAAGIRHMIFVTGRNKRAIEDHFDTAYELESELEASQQARTAGAGALAVSPTTWTAPTCASRARWAWATPCCAPQPLVGDEPFAVLLADDLMSGPGRRASVLAQMVEVFERVPTSLLAVQEVPLEHVKRYGIVAGEPAGERLIKVRPDGGKAVARSRAFAHGRGRPLHPHARRVRRTSATSRAAPAARSS